MRRGEKFDLVVVGGGPAGLAAADAAAEAGLRTLLVDQNPLTGGQIWRRRAGSPPPAGGARLLADVVPPRVSVASRASVIDVPEPGALTVSFGGRVAVVETAAVILATGAVERFLPFPGWTLPGVTGVGALQALAKSGYDFAGERVVLSGTGPLLLAVAKTLAAARAELVLTAEQASPAKLARFAFGLVADPHKLAEGIRHAPAALGGRYRTGSWVIGAEGDDRLRSVSVNVAGKVRTIECRWLGAAAGLVPRTELAAMHGCMIVDGAVAVDAEQRTTVPGVWAAGELTGVKGDQGAVVEGRIAALSVAGRPVPAVLSRLQRRGRRFAALMARAFEPRPELVRRVTPDTVVCRCEDVRAAAIDPSWSQRQAKLWVRVGMGACQGAVCGPACGMLYGWQPNAPRPPLEQPAVAGWAQALGGAQE